MSYLVSSVASDQPQWKEIYTAEALIYSIDVLQNEKKNLILKTTDKYLNGCILSLKQQDTKFWNLVTVSFVLFLQ